MRRSQDSRLVVSCLIVAAAGRKRTGRAILRKEGNKGGLTTMNEEC